MILQRYVFKQLLATFAALCVTLLFLILVGAILQTFRVSNVLGLGFILQNAPTLLAYVSPFAVLISTAATTTLVYGRLSADNEIDAARVSGVHVMRLLAPAATLGLILSLITYWLVQFIVPEAHYDRRSFMRQTARFLLGSPPPGRQNLSIGNYTLSYLGVKNKLLISPYLVTTDSEGKLQSTFEAHHARLELREDGVPQIIFYNGIREEYDEKRGSKSSTFERYSMDPPVDVRARPKTPSDMNYQELLDAIHDARVETRQEQNTVERLNRLSTEWHIRNARSLTPFVLTLIGCGVGILVRRGSRLAGLGASLPSIVAYFVLWLGGQNLGYGGQLNPLIASYAPVALLILAGTPLFYNILRK